MKSNFRICGLLLASSLWAAASGFAQGKLGDARAALNPSAATATLQPSAPATEESKIDFAALKDQLAGFQQVLNRSIQQAFEQPFSLLQDAKGIYLPHFGVAFHMEVNLHPLRYISMFDQRPYTAEELKKARESKQQRILQLKDRLRVLLVERGGDLQALPLGQNVVVVVHLFNLPSEQSDGLPIQLVFGTSRRSLLDYQAHRLTPEEFRNREFSLEF